MISLELFFIELLAFCKRMIRTVTYTLFQPSKLQDRSLQENDKLLLDSEVFLLLSQFLLISILTFYGIDNPLDMISSVFQNVSYGNRLLFLLPCYLLTLLLGKAFSLLANPNKRKTFERIFRYTVGALNFIILIVGEILDIILFFADYNDKVFRVMNFVAMSILTGIFVTFSLLYYKLNIEQNTKKIRSLFLPLSVFIFFLLFILITRKIMDYVTLNDEKTNKTASNLSSTKTYEYTLQFIQVGSSNLVLSEDTSLTPQINTSDSALRLTFQLLIRNNNEGQVIFNQCKYELTYQPLLGNSVDTSAGHEMKFCSSCKNDSLGLLILNKNDVVRVYFSGVISKNLVKYFIKNSIKNFKVSYPVTPIDLSPSSLIKSFNIEVFFSPNNLSFYY